MVRLEIADGLVTLRFHQPYEAGDEPAYLAALEEVALVQGPFVLLTIFGGGPALSQGGDKAQALWFKRTRATMDERCRALAMVRPGATKEMAHMFQKLWRFPVMATADEGEARRFLAAHSPAERSAS
ncbi:MAG TPA: hypothetical protein VNR39_11115 [Pseudolabrys sp.]|nr:hypothetical protein [Pseudolabrys sp.]